MIFWNPYLRSSRRGFTLIETVVSFGIMAFVFSISSYLIFLTARNAFHLHDQFMSQRSAASAAEQLAGAVRNGVCFERYTGDDDTTLTRVKVVFASSPTTTFKHTIARYTDADGKCEIKYYDHELALGDFTGEHNNPPVAGAMYRFPGLSNVDFLWQTEYHITLSVHYLYRGFALLGDPYQNMDGQFITDIVCRNHAMDKGVNNYAQSDSIGSPASLANYVLQ